MSIQYFEDLMDQTGDLQLDLLALERLKNFDPKASISHDDMLLMIESDH